MKPIKFPQANAALHAPAGMEKEVETLHVARTEAVSEHGRKQTYHISLWQLSWWERVKVLFTGRVWLWVMSYAHPPVVIATEHPWKKRVDARLAELGGKVGPVRRWMTRRKVAAAVRDGIKEAGLA